MLFFAIAFIAGALTVLAPCILPMLPVVVGASSTGRKSTPYVVVAALSISIVLFTYLLKVSSVFIAIPLYVWSYVSGAILVFFGLTLVFPSLWARIPGIAQLNSVSQKSLGSSAIKGSTWGDFLVGFSLGPVFSTCSPTYFVILASVLPVSFLLGTLYLFAYVAGLSLALLLIGWLGERVTSRFEFAADPRGLFKKVMGLIFILLGVGIAFGYDKALETAILDLGYFDVTMIERGLLEKLEI